MCVSFHGLQRLKLLRIFREFPRTGTTPVILAHIFIVLWPMSTLSGDLHIHKSIDINKLVDSDNKLIIFVDQNNM